MVIGGIPQYLAAVEKGESATMAIDRTCFTKDGLLLDEFNSLSSSMFDDAGFHMDIIRALARKGVGLTCQEIIKACKLTTGGGTTHILSELAESGFITPYLPFDRKAKDCIYKLTDEYAHFYIKFIENSQFKGPGSWTRFADGTSWKSWSGYAFEGICMKHTPQLKKALGIENVLTETSVWRYRSKNGEKDAQIDLLIDRRDQCINLCEMKFSINTFGLTRNYVKELENKINFFGESVSPRKTLFLTMITTHGVENTHNFVGLIHNLITMSALFK